MSDFHFRKDSNKYRTTCKSCWNKKCTDYYETHKEERLAYLKTWQEQNKEKVSAYKNTWLENNQDKRKEVANAWVKRNLKYCSFQCSKRRAKLLQAIPKWADLEAIEEFYKNRPEDCHVDHIIPLQGKNVCGLHVLNNLQYLPAAENLRKSNKYEP